MEDDLEGSPRLASRVAGMSHLTIRIDRGGARDMYLVADPHGA
jgi:hypothetical protein